MDSQHQQYPTDSVQQPVPKILPAAEFFSIVRKKLLAGRNVCFRVTGNSMFPLFRAGRDSVCIRPCSSVTIEKPKRGDIILFCISGKYILHRVMRIEGNRVVTAGDGNRGFDAFASPQNPLRLIPLSKQSEQPNDSSRLNDSDESERTGDSSALPKHAYAADTSLILIPPHTESPPRCGGFCSRCVPLFCAFSVRLHDCGIVFLRNRTENKYIFINSIFIYHKLKGSDSK